jgi:hypothetical protein
MRPAWLGQSQQGAGTEQIIRRSGLPWLMSAGAYVLLLALGPRLLSDPDTYSHFALGRWILDHHSVPTTDPLSANFRATHTGFRWSGSRKSHLQEPTQLEVGLASSR